MSNEATARFVPPPGALDGVLVAVSGGADSTALALRVAQDPAVRRVVLGWVDHGYATPTAEPSIRALARHLDVPLCIAHRPPPARWSPGESVAETHARHVRYDALEQMALCAGIPTIATGHHQSDQVETRLLHILRGGGVRTLAGITPWRTRGRLHLWRPLLRERPADLATAVREAGLPVWDDPSNRDLRVRRNRLRHRVLGSMAQSGDPWLAHHDAWARHAAGAMGRIDRLIADWIASQRAPSAALGWTHVPAAPLQSWSPPLLHHVLEHILACPSGVTEAMSRDWTTWIRRPNAKGARTSHGVRVERSGRWLSWGLSPVPPFDVSAHTEEPPPGVSWTARLSDSALGPTSVPIGPQTRIRSARAGDRRGSGTARGDKLAQRFIGLGIPRSERPAWPVVVDGEGLVAVPGVLAPRVTDHVGRWWTPIGLPCPQARREALQT